MSRRRRPAHGSWILAAVTRSAIVTGGASGIGRAVAQRLAADGFPVLVADVRRDPLTGGEPTDAQIAAAGGEASTSRPTCRRGRTARRWWRGPSTATGRWTSW